jgi:hypothetical protein
MECGVFDLRLANKCAGVCGVPQGVGIYPPSVSAERVCLAKKELMCIIKHGRNI